MRGATTAPCSRTSQSTISTLILLETSSYPPGFAHGDHHEAFGLDVEPLASELLTLCFCRHCVRRAKESDLDLLKARTVVRDTLDTTFGMPAHALRNTPFAEKIRTSHVLVSDSKPLMDVLSFQREVVDDVFMEAKSTLKDAKSKSELHVLAFGGFSGENAFGRGAGGQNIGSLSKIVDGVDLMTYVTEPDQLYYLVKWTKFEAGSCPLYVALRPSYPTLFTREGIATHIRYALEAGASGVAFYNYGWTPLQNFKWIKDGLESARLEAGLRGRRRTV